MRALDRFWRFWFVGGLFIVALQVSQGDWFAAVMNALVFSGLGLLARASHREQLGLSSSYTRGLTAWNRFGLRHPWLLSSSIALVVFALLSYILGGPAEVHSAPIVFGVAASVASVFGVIGGWSASRGPGHRKTLRWLDKHAPDALDGLRPEGWYTDPTTRDRWRWWDGNRWTEYESAERQRFDA